MFFVSLLVVMVTGRTRALSTFKLVIRIERLEINYTVQFTNRCLQLGKKIPLTEREGGCDRASTLHRYMNVVE